MMDPKRWLKPLVLAIAVQVPLVATGWAQTVTVETSLLEELQKVIQQQQQQIERQSEVLETLQKQVKDLQKTATEAQSEASEAMSTAKEARDVADLAVPREERNLMTSGEDRIKLSVSGQVNRAVNVANDNDETKTYFVDNDVSNTRFRLIGTGKVTDDFTIGSRIEFAFTSNESSDVSQDNENPDDFFDVRWADLNFDSKRFGTLYFGKGQTASDDTSEVDLSRTDVITYSGVSDIAGGLQFLDNDDNLTGVRVNQGFNNLDGLGRDDRVRYDTPSFYGFKLGGSIVADQRWDAALKWGGQGFGFKMAAAASVSDRKESGEDIQYNGSASFLHESTGLNLTLSGGRRGRDNQGDSSNAYVKGGWLADFFSVGPTAFGVDYTKTTNFPTGSDEGYSVGAGVVQAFDDFGTELYVQYRMYNLEREGGPGFEDIHVGTAGARVKF